MNQNIPYLILGVRVSVAWWALLAALTALVSGDMAIFGAMLLYPPVAIVIGAFAAMAQWRAKGANVTGTDPLALGHRQTIHLELPQKDTLRMARNAIEASFGKLDQHVTAGSVSVRVSPLGALSRWSDGLRTDIVTLDVQALEQEQGPAHTILEMHCEPVHRWFYAFLWVDAGRCAGRVETLQVAILARLHAQQAQADAAAKRDALQARLDQAELLLLRAQIEPHFLFNTLAHLRACIGSDPVAACAMLDRLVEFLRDSSRMATRALTPLSEELVRVENYLKLMAIRLDDRLRYTIDCDPGLGAQQVPTGGVLVLAENAIKHGIERIDSSGAVRVSCQRSGDTLVIDVDNDGPSLAPASYRGMGLGNLRERLRLSFGAAAQLHIEDGEVTGVRASLQIPLAADRHAH